MAYKKNIQIELIETNKGQIEGVPANPRVIKDKKFKKLVKSIEENPEMLDLREILVYPLGDKFIAIGGNMRLEAVKKLGYKDVPCKVLPVETPVENLRAYILRDNASYGEWDFDELANCWDIDELEMADIEVTQIDVNTLDDDFVLPEGEKKPFQQMAFLLADAQALLIKEAIDMLGERWKKEEMFGNTNKNANALYTIVKEWKGLQKWEEQEK
jgi:ParB-like chromosome segregation protein Spo0J